MELDELRRQWQQPEPEAPPLSRPQLEELLSRNSDGLVEKMRRNAHLETAFTLLMALAMPVVMIMAHNAMYRMQALALLLLCLGMLGYYYRKLAMLRQMTQPEGNVRGNLQKLSSGLRSMLRFNYRLTLASGPLSLLLTYGFIVGRELARPEGVRPKLLLVLGGTLLALGILLYWAAMKVTRWYLQRLYGQHLDRLESYLRELDEPAE